MAKAARAHVEEQSEAADLVVMASVNPLLVFTDEQQFSQFYEKLKSETAKHTPDVSTERGRSAVRSLAFKVTKAKTTLDKAGLGLTEEWRQKTALVNASRKKMVAELDALAAEVRQPLTEWENAEKARLERCMAVIQRIRDAAVISIDDTADAVRQRGADVWEIEIGDEFHGELRNEAEGAKEAAVATLGRALNRLIKEEEDRAELQRLRAEAAEREERDAAEREERERAEREARDRSLYADTIIDYIKQVRMGFIGGQPYPYVILLRELEEKVELGAQHYGDRADEVQRARDEALTFVRATMEEAERRAREKEDQEREEAARVAAERAAEDARISAEQKAEQAIAEANRQREEAERVAREERERRQQEEAERLAQEAEDRKREANRAHRSRVQSAAKEAIMACGVAEAVAKDIVKAIVAGRVPAVSMAF